jgi:hypothetical protein
VIKKVKQVVSEAKYFLELEKLIPQLDTSLPARGIASSVSQLFKLVDPKSIKRFHAEAPLSLTEHQDSSVRAMCARLSRGKQLHSALNDPAKAVRQAAMMRLNEVGETMPDTAPLVDLSKEYYNNIAYRLIKDYPDNTGDWITAAVKATVNSYRTTSGVTLDPVKLKAAVKEKFAEMQESNTFYSCLEEAIEHLDEMIEQDDQDTEVICDDEEDESDNRYTLESDELPALIQQRMFNEHNSIVVDGPKTIIFERKLTSEAKQIAQRITDTMNCKLRGVAKVRWIVESPNSISFLYKS